MCECAMFYSFKNDEILNYWKIYKYHGLNFVPVVVYKDITLCLILKSDLDVLILPLYPSEN